MLETGSPLVESLEALADQSAGEKVGAVLRSVARDVRGGSPLSNALEAHPRVFSPFYVSAVQAGESGGGLVQVFKRLENYLQKREDLAAAARTALIYPAILTLLASGAVIFMVTFVLPRFALIFSGHGAILPLPTRALLGISHVCASYWYLLVIGVVGAVVGAYLYGTSERGQPVVDRLVLKLPAIGPLAAIIQSSTFLRMVGTLLSAGVPLLETMELAERACTNSLYKKAISRIATGILRGEGFSANFSKSDLVSPTVKQMVATGERTGEMSLVMNKMADYLDDAAEKGMKKLSAVIEPLIIIIMGAVVGFIAVAVLLPLFRLTSVVKGGA